MAAMMGLALCKRILFSLSHLNVENLAKESCEFDLRHFIYGGQKALSQLFMGMFFHLYGGRHIGHR